MSTYTRGNSVTFSHLFLDPTGQPIVPIGVGYPQVQVQDPAGTIAASGVATATAVPGQWSWIWAVPPDATLGEGWKTTWTLVDPTAASFEYIEIFEVSDQIQMQEGLDRTGGYLSMIDTSERLFWKSAVVDPVELTVTMRAEGHEALWSRDKSSDLLHYVYSDGYHTYWTETGQLSDDESYIVVWRSRDTELTPYVNQVQTVVVPHDSFWFVLPYLRHLLDKLSKVTTTPLSYLDYELWQSFDMGLNFVNAVHPRTTWNWHSFPHDFRTWWVFAASIYALNARQLLEIEIQHNLSALSVTLEYDHASPISDILARYETMLREWFMPAKIAAYRQASGPGVVGVRPPRISFQHRVYRVGQSSAALNEFPGLLASIGLVY